jgi:fatty-acyl-CoA synthase
MLPPLRCLAGVCSALPPGMRSQFDPMAVDYLALQAALQPNRLAAKELTSGQEWSYRQFDTGVWQMAAALRARGVTAGERVAVLAKNRVSLPMLHLACARAGAIFVPLNWRLSAHEFPPVLADAEPVLILGDAQLEPAGLHGVSFDEFEVQAAETAPLPAHDYDQARTSLILYTSGTSGKPKGVMLSEQNCWATGQNFGVLARVDSHSAVLCDSPMFHVIGLIGNIRPTLMHGGAILVSDGFVAARTLDRLAAPELGVTHYFCVPQMATMLRNEPSYNPVSLRHLTGIFSGGAPHPAEAIRAFTRQAIALANGYGMTEAAGTVCCMPVDLTEIEQNIGASGLMPPGVQVRIVNEAEENVPPGATGEILVRGSNVSAGYWRRPAETKAAFTDDGWYRSGDIGSLDAQGYLYVVDRKKDMFISGGENIYPAEIEAALADFPGIAECAVIGVPDERWGEAGHLCVALLPGFETTAEPLTAHLSMRLARYKIPKHVTIMKALPRNAAGKLVKAQLKNFVS